MQETTALVKQQLALLWSGSLVYRLTECLPLAERDECNPNPRQDSPADDQRNLVAAFKKVLNQNKVSRNQQTGAGGSHLPLRKIGSPLVTQVALVFTMFQTALSTLTQLRMDILTGTLSILYIIDHK